MKPHTNCLKPLATHPTMSMLKFIKSLSLVYWLLLPFVSEAQSIDSAILQKRWPAFWVTVPNESTDGYGVYLFRKTVTLNTKPGKFIIHVSADTVINYL